MECYADIESDGLLPVLSTIHSLVVKEKDGAIHSCTDHEGYEQVETGINILKKSDKIIGHNFISFDAPALAKLGYGNMAHKVLDTYNLAMLLFPEIIQYDYANSFEFHVPKNLWGSHSLKAWGYRLGVHKGEFGETTDWSEWSEEMQIYCEQDVLVTEQLYLYLMEKKPAPLAVSIEMDIQRIMAWQEREGIPFDTTLAYNVKKELEEKIAALEAQIKEVVPPNKKVTVFIPKRDNSKKGYVKGVPIERVTTTPFNPNSRQQIISYLEKKYKWKPTEYTDKGNPRVTAEDLEYLGQKHAEVKAIAQFLEANKLASMLYGGKQAWLNFVCDGRIHGRVKVNGALTGRATHSNPNLAQVPSPRAFMGKECRQMFYAPEGHVIVGADASGLELRMLAHYLHQFDRGAYAKIILESDVHVHNQTAAGLQTRDLAKTFIYSFLYGCGAAKTGAMCYPDKTEFEQKQLGYEVQRSFTQQIRGFEQLKMLVSHRYNTQKYLVGLDGRKLWPRGEHSALNTLLQGAGAIVCKYWVNKTWKLMVERGLVSVAKPALWVHDEQQLIVKEEYADKVGEVMVEAIRLTGEELKIRIPLDAEYRVGKTWYDTH
jgi:DNA polymerase I-like protein with 3'-5' exonuclease and polymerase domains